MEEEGLLGSFFNHLTDHSQFLPIVQSQWMQAVSGSSMFKVRRKLQGIKAQLKTLHAGEQEYTIKLLRLRVTWI